MKTKQTDPLTALGDAKELNPKTKVRNSPDLGGKEELDYKGSRRRDLEMENPEFDDGVGGMDDVTDEEMRQIQANLRIQRQVLDEEDRRIKEIADSHPEPWTVLAGAQPRSPSDETRERAQRRERQ
eukprot:CAMPEP_0184492398 /NCGR_PEP_ID=MMETSP0113_2-20130426/23119_1 /TAXON_ID=91329 /ORGANISM="Norrisiella sphaerica, Strain BC52" /LENGTH=125 /DNA_ID=CAMNT_0026877179 /DNA_START=133 /DNA_END=506 /DNA_ORIENTATION=+